MTAIEAFVKAAAKHVTTDGTDEWNEMVDAWEVLPNKTREALLRGELAPVTADVSELEAK